MKPKGGPKCSRRSHSLWLKCSESRKRVMLGRKIFCSHGDLKALTFTESGQVCVQEDTGSQAREWPRRATSQGLGWALHFDSSDY